MNNLPMTNLSGKYIYSVYIANDLITDSITLTDDYAESHKKFLNEILPIILRWRGLNVPEGTDVNTYWWRHHFKYSFEAIDWLEFKGGIYEAAKHNLETLESYTKCDLNFDGFYDTRKTLFGEVKGAK